jgi:TfoX/Sxy family transcriptional regulator of competence genes
VPSYEEIVDDLVHRHPHVKAKKMFGMDGFTANGKAAGGLTGKDMVFKLTDAAHREQALALTGAHLFEPMPGRTMKEWVVVPKAHADRWPDLAELAVG